MSVVWRRWRRCRQWWVVVKVAVTALAVVVVILSDNIRLTHLAIDRAGNPQARG
jgi:hypothetical protein